jgi:hypothetical protein
MPIINEPISQERVVVMDLVDHVGNVIVPQATYKLKETYTRLGVGGIEVIDAAQCFSIGRMTTGSGENQRNRIVFLGRIQGENVAAVRLNYLNLKTNYSLVETKECEKVAFFVTPNFSSGSGPEMNKQWEVPTGWELYLIVSSGSTVFMLARKSGATGIYRAPFPNIYGNGQVCIGPDTQTNISRSEAILDKLNIAIDGMLSNRWNSDLAEDTSLYATHLRWCAEHGYQIPSPHNDGFFQQVLSVEHQKFIEACS